MARPDDLPAIETLGLALFADDARHDQSLVTQWPTQPATGQAYYATRVDEEGVLFVAELAGEVVGFLAGAMCPPETYRRGTRSELESMYVTPPARESGIGTALVEAFIGWSRQQGATEVFVAAYFNDAPAITLYHSNGFQSFSHDLLLPL